MEITSEIKTCLNETLQKQSSSHGQ